MDYQHLLYKVADGVLTLTINRPERYNALTQQTKLEMIDALKRAKRSDAVRVIVLTGAGDKAFCSGQDLKSVQAHNDTHTEKRNLGTSLTKYYNPIVQRIYDMPKPVICRLNGVAAGAGASFALACDMVVAAEHASLLQAFVKIGLVLDSGSSYFLPRLLGAKKAFELATLGNKLGAKQALDLGLINKVVPYSELDAAIKKLTDYYATAPTKAVGLIKAMLHKGNQADLASSLAYEAYCQEIAGYSADYKEGVKAFTEKRKPNFTGN